jgi:hypothetical protein
MFKTSMVKLSKSAIKIKQEVLGRTDRLLSFVKTRTG